MRVCGFAGAKTCKNTHFLPGEDVRQIPRFTCKSDVSDFGGSNPPPPTKIYPKRTCGLLRVYLFSAEGIVDSRGGKAKTQFCAAGRRILPTT